MKNKLKRGNMSSICPKTEVLLLEMSVQEGNNVVKT